jgi:hypothetical protein
MSWLAGFGCDHPDHAVVSQGGDGVHQAVDEIAVVITPPQQDDVDHLVGVFVEQLTAARVLDVGPDVVVGVLVPAQLLHNLIFLDAQSLGEARGVVRRDHRRSSFSQLGALCVRSYRRTTWFSSHSLAARFVDLSQYAASQRFSAEVFVSLSRVIAALNSSEP